MRNAFRFSQPGRVEGIPLGIAQVGVYSHTVGVGNDGRIVGALHSTLDLKRVNACLHQTVDDGQGTEIL